MEHYPFKVFWDEDSDCWVAIAPDFPGSSACGDTRVEAIAEMEVCLEGWLETYRDEGLPIPEPSLELA